MENVSVNVSKGGVACPVSKDIAGRVATAESNGNVVSYAAPVFASKFSVNGSVGDIVVDGSIVENDFFIVEVTVT